MKKFLLSGSFLLISGIVIQACSAGPKEIDTDISTEDDNSHRGEPGTKQGGGDILVTPQRRDDQKEDSTCENTCSTDLHQVLDCKGKLVRECSADQGCRLGGSCVSPCESASSNQSTIGCDFYSMMPSPQFQSTGSCFAALIANTWTTPLAIQVVLGAQSPVDAAVHTRVPAGSGKGTVYKELTDGKLQPGEVGIVFLHQFNSGDIYHTSCPDGVVPFTTEQMQISGTGRGKAFRVITDRPVIAYDIYPYGGATSHISSATLLQPVPSWGDNFVAADAYEAIPGTEQDFPYTQIVASMDGTEVTISPLVEIKEGNGVTGALKRVPVSYTLDAGEFLQISQRERLIGSPIRSNKPVGVWGGTSCMIIPLTSGACESAHQQLLPVKSMGYSYVGAGFRNRSKMAENYPYTIVGAVNGTRLNYDPAPPPGAPSKLELGEMFLFDAASTFSVSSQDSSHPFYLASHMEGAAELIEDSVVADGDPEFVNVISSEQYLDEYLFFTDLTYRTTHLVFVRKKNKAGLFDDVTLDCVGPVSGWEAVGTRGQFEFLGVDLVTDNIPQGKCDNGLHTAKSATPFGLTVWGWDDDVSYAYPAGMSVKPVNNVVVPVDPVIL